jgi:hypothetical protein
VPKLSGSSPCPDATNVTSSIHYDMDKNHNGLSVLPTVIDEVYLYGISYALFETILMLWHVEPLSGNDSEISKYITAIAK